MSQNTGKGDALRKEKALLHTFVAGQKYGVWRDAPRRFCLSKKQQGQQIYHMLPQASFKRHRPDKKQTPHHMRGLSTI
jgi:hypothetical protein